MAQRRNPATYEGASSEGWDQYDDSTWESPGMPMGQEPWMDVPQGTPQPPAAAPQAAPAPGGDPLQGKVADIYKKFGLPELRDDELQQFNLRMSQGQSPDEILKNTLDDAATRFPLNRGGGGGSPSGPQGPGTPRVQSNSTLNSTLEGLYAGGLNKDIVSQRVSGARDDMERARKSTSATNRAALASRGLIGDGPEITAMNRADERLGDTYAQEIGDIYADEGGNADQRMMQALSLAAGLSTADADRLVRQFEAETNRTGMQGNLALGNLRAGNDYSLGLGNLGLGRDQLLQAADAGDMDRMIELIQLLLQGAGQGAQGYL